MVAPISFWQFHDDNLKNPTPAIAANRT